MKCSVVILNWNGSKMLREFMPSVSTHTIVKDISERPMNRVADIELVVADNGSTDDSLSFLKSEYPSVRIIALDKNYGFAEGYNRAIAQCPDSEYVILLNSDVAVQQGWIETIVNYMDANPQVAACQPLILSYREQRNFEHAGAAGGMMDTLGYPFCRGRILNYVETNHGQYPTSDALFWASGACMCVRRQAYIDAGGLDADFFAHMEEIDLCWRLLCRGWKVACVAETQVYHLGGGTLNYVSPQKTYLNFRNNLLMLYKNLPNRYLLPIWLSRLVLDYIAALQYLLTFKGKHFLSVLKARKDAIAMCMTKTFRQKRQNNLQAAVTTFPPTISKRSIIFDFYICRKKH